MPRVADVDQHLPAGPPPRGELLAPCGYSDRVSRAAHQPQELVASSRSARPPSTERPAPFALSCAHFLGDAREARDPRWRHVYRHRPRSSSTIRRRRRTRRAWFDWCGRARRCSSEGRLASSLSTSSTLMILWLRNSCRAWPVSARARCAGACRRRARARPARRCAPGRSQLLRDVFNRVAESLDPCRAIRSRDEGLDLLVDFS